MWMCVRCPIQLTEHDNNKESKSLFGRQFTTELNHKPTVHMIAPSIFEQLHLQFKPINSSNLDNSVILIDNLSELE
jgi:hypothetical protein